MNKKKLEEDIRKALFWLLDNKHNLDSGICEQVTGRADKDYLLALNKIVNKSLIDIANLKLSYERDRIKKIFKKQSTKSIIYDNEKYIRDIEYESIINQIIEDDNNG